MLIDDMRRRMADAFKAGRSTEKNILRLAVGEVQTLEARGTVIDDAAVVAVIRKLIKSNDETMALARDETARATLGEENAVLRSLLPQTLDVAAIMAALAGVAEAIRGAANDGQATGIAMKTLKASGAEVNGKDVTMVVKAMRL